MGVSLLLLGLHLLLKLLPGHPDLVVVLLDGFLRHLPLVGMRSVETEWAHIAQKYFAEDLSEEEIARYTRHGLQGMKKRLYGVRLHARKVPKHALHYLRNLLHPHGKLQERVLNWGGFQGQAKENLVQALIDQLHWNQTGHLYIYWDN